MTLEPVRFTYALTSSGKCLSGYFGEIIIHIDSEETAFITPPRHIGMTEQIQNLLIETLRPLGIKYMRWWVDGRLIGRTFYEEV